jgi:hypothetical protein
METELKRYRIFAEYAGIERISAENGGKHRECDVTIKTSISKLMERFASQGWVIYQYYEID